MTLFLRRLWPPFRTTQSRTSFSSCTMTTTKRQVGSRTGIVVEKQKEISWTTTPPAHHANKSATHFRNPWPSFRFLPPSRWIKFFLTWATPKVPIDLNAQIPSQVPDWGADAAPGSVKATWLGHACFLVEMPIVGGAVRGPRILFDPVFSHRCSPFTWLGPERLLPTPCVTEDLPEIDAVVISHNHYDHMDAATIKALWTGSQPHFFAPLGNMPHLTAMGIPVSHVHLLDWWEEVLVSISLPTGVSVDDVKASFVLTCTPSQHTAGRSAFDRWHTLWSSWAVTEHPLTPLAEREPKKVYFAGDTGYRTVLVGEDEDAVPRCPAFKEIGEKFGGFDLALLPIGAYAPRDMWSGLHASPADAVEMFKDVKAKKALAMHWGTWILTTEPIMQPPELLKKYASQAGLPSDAFTVCALGETTAA